MAYPLHLLKGSQLVLWFLCLSALVHTSSVALKPQQIRPNPILWFTEYRKRHAVWNIWTAEGTFGGTTVPPSSSKVPTPLSTKVPVNHFLPPPPPDVCVRVSELVLGWCNKQLVTVVIVTACCGEWFVWVVIDLGVFSLFKQSNYWFCLLFCLCAISLFAVLCPSLPTSSLSLKSLSILASIFRPLISYLFNSFLSQRIICIDILSQFTPETRSVAEAAPSTINLQTNKKSFLYVLCSCLLWNHWVAVITGRGSGHEYDTNRV